MKRIFLAVDITQGPRLVEACDLIKYRLRMEKINWVPSRQWHITLAFLGDMEEDVVPSLVTAAGEAVKPHPAFSLTLSSVGLFRSLRDPRIIWVGCSVHPVFRKIKEDLDEALTGFGYEPENREFLPHLTLGRIKYMRNQNQLAEVITLYKDVVFQEELTRNIVLYESKLTPEGPEYGVVKRFDLRRS